ncbi:uncharacterized protein LOC132730352 [Ruditapes philippinarum]|uniref:uncharacterized protein LOC132730352 n=1 Tax=Ruditapes philippinarum TaxID=129788 RepID=UPI00295C1C5E|nr:uncharacterized protein LOC132730352 [Ruditapes philippinarum]
MFQEPDYIENLSLMLSEVLHDIGINERLMMRRRRGMMLYEAINNITYRLIDIDFTIYFLGSKSESTTISGLHSDNDALICLNDTNVIQEWSEWEHNKENYLMIQDENTTPGYCYLQLLRDDEPLPVTDMPNEYHITDSSERVLLKNTLKNGAIPGAVCNGPSNTIPGPPGFCDSDTVIAFHCKSWHQSASGWLERQGIGRWPTQEMRRYASSTGCFVVPTGSKVSEYPELEWRISTTLAERCLIFNLNITQIRCFVLLKMILKTFLNPEGEINVSSFMCKTVLLHCIENTEPSIWRENNLFSCLTYCLLELHSCVENNRCSHFIIKHNNLMAGQFTAETKHELLKNISDVLQNDSQLLLRIDIANLGQRLQVKLNIVPDGAYYYLSSIDIYEFYLTTEYLNSGYLISSSYTLILIYLHSTSIRTMKQFVGKLINFSVNSNRLEQTAYKFLAPFVFTTYGSALASSSIGENNQVLPESLVWLSAGLNLDISSSTFKLASIFYCTGDLEKAELILRHTEQQYDSYPVVIICSCWDMPPPTVYAECMRVFTEEREDNITHITAFCVRFMQKEINCVPRELQYCLDVHKVT